MNFCVVVKLQRKATVEINGAVYHRMLCDLLSNVERDETTQKHILILLCVVILEQCYFYSGMRAATKPINFFPGLK